MMLTTAQYSFGVRFVLLLALAAGMVAVNPQIDAVRAAELPGATWYVAPTGSDANSCSSVNSPCGTINRALEKAAAGDIVKVATGTYTGSGHQVVYISKDITLSGGWNASFTTQSGLSIIDGQGVRSGIFSQIETVMINVVIDRFRITNGFIDRSGSGLYHRSGILLLSNSIVSGNVTPWTGGGIYNQGTMTINNSVISNNQISQECCGGSGGGGGIENYGTLTLNYSTVSGNVIMHESNFGSGIYSQGTLTLNNSTIHGNGGGHGEGIRAEGTITINNSTIYGNSGSHGEGIQAEGTITINNSTISGNQSYGLAARGTVTLRNTIIAGNGTDNVHGDCFTYDGEPLRSQGHNLIGDVSECHFVPAAGDLIGVDARLGQLVGSPVYLPLLPGSPAIDAGNPGTCLANDQRGLARPQGSTCDIGAYEYAVPGTAASVGVVEGSGQQAEIGLAFAKPLTAYVFDSQGSPVPGVNVTFTAPGSGASGTFAPGATRITSAVSNSSGVATSSSFIANNLDGSYQVTASVSGVVAPASFSLANVPAWYVATTGSDANSCSSMGSPCKTINAAIAKAATGSTIRVALGTYTGTGAEVVLIDKGVTLSGGWNAGFNTQTGRSIIDGRDVRRGVTSTGTNVVIDRFTIQNGFQAYQGGGLRNQGGPMMLSNSLISGNATDGRGGGIFNDGRLTINNTTISGNRAGKAGTSGGGGGGGIHNYFGWLTLNNTTVSGNTILGLYEGSGIYVYGTAILNNSTISGNTGGGGEGMYISYTPTGNVIINNSTIAFNGSYGFRTEWGGIVLQNTILALNGSGRDCYTPDYGWEVMSRGYNLIGNGSACKLNATPVDLVGSDTTPIDPLLGPLQDNGGWTPTHALLLGSPAIDTGNPAIPESDWYACLVIDQRGVPRPQGDGCDIGAYEVKGPIEISIAGNAINSYALLSGESKRISLPGINSGPVKIMDARSGPLIAAERVIYKINDVNTSFAEMMGLPDNQLDNTYWLPWYNNKDLDTQLRFANVSASPATVTITIGEQQMGAPIQLAAGASTRISFPGVNNGPVKIVSTRNIVAAERLIYKVGGVNTSFTEMMALPNKSLDTTYWLPWYNNADLDTQLRFANVSGSPASVHVYIGGVEMQGSPFPLAAGESTRKSFPGINDGPVQIVSNVNIVAAERLIYKVNGVNTSFTEMMALPNSALGTAYWLPWYNNKDLDTQLRFANVHDSQTATVHVYIGGAETTGSPFTLLPGESMRKSFSNVNDGPVQIVSNVNIVAAERLIYKVNGVATSFSEMMALPTSQLDTTYWLPWYNNVDLDTQLRFGVP
jgi:hypothetical protein